MAKSMKPASHLGGMAAAAILVILAGCNEFPFDFGTATQTAAAPSLPPPPPRKPAAPGVPASPAVARLPETAPSPPGPAGFDRLIGLDQPQLMNVLGEPVTRAEAPPATIWSYQGQACELKVYFYFDLQSQAMRALHYEVRSHDLPERSAQRCYNALISERPPHADSAAGSDRPR